MKQLQADSLYEFKTVTSPNFSADGEMVVSVVTSIDKETNEYHAHLHVNKVNSNEPAVPITFGEAKNSMPKWSPVDDKLAFLSNRAGKMQLYVKEGLAEARKVADENNGITSFFWSPDGKKLAYTTYYKEEAKVDKAFPKPVHIEKMKYKSDARGLHDESILRVAAVDVITGKKTWLTEADFDTQLLGFSADSTAVLVARDKSEDRDFSFTADVCLLDLVSKEETKITDEPMAVSGAAVSPNGKLVVLLGHYREFENATLPSLYLFDLETNQKRLLNDGRDILIGDLAIGDFLQNTGANQVIFNEESNAIYALVSSEGSVNVWSFHLDGKVEQHSETTGHINGFTLNQKNLYVTYSDSVNPSELFQLENGELKRVTVLNKGIEETFQLNKPEKIKLERADGTKVEGWLMKPNTYKDGATFPLILEVHGGPHAMYAHTYFHEFQMLTAKGYGVLYTNPRGSHGYGQAFVDAVRGDMVEEILTI
ncbi:acylamino-acid-releasing enzyme [Bacillus sp. JCM 19046]|nr:acylamino-acid-releasing enzyme [Bacillus sp. JCM 19046]